MDDKEYYSYKRITSLSLEQLQRNIRKVDNSKYRNNLVRQGSSDALMLQEKQDTNETFTTSLEQ